MMPNDTAGVRSKEPAIPSGFLKLNEIKGETETQWLWPDKIPIGHVTIVAGEASSGKSLLAAELAAHASSGTGWGDTSGPKPPGAVLLAHSNRQENLVLKRRLLAAGADASRVNVVNCDTFERHRPADSSGDKGSAGVTPIYTLEGALIQIRGASLVVIDDLQGWLGQTRLKPEELIETFKLLADMAARYRVALVVLWRLEKAGRAAQTRQLDALSAAAPVVWLLASDTYSAQTRLAVCAQNRLGAQAESLAFGVEGDRLVWRQAVRQASADDVLAARTADRPERRQAGQWLLKLLSHGPVKAKQLFGEARACGLSERTVRRAADELDLHPTKDGRQNVWMWGVRSPEIIKAEGKRQKAEIRCASEGNPASQDAEQNVTALPEEARRVSEGNQAVPVTEQNVAVLPDAPTNEGRDNRDGYPTDSAVVQAQPRPDAPQNVAALPEEVRRVSEGNQAAPVTEQNVAVLPDAHADDGQDNRDGYPTDSAVLQAQPRPDAPPEVEELICRDAACDPEEQKMRADLAAAVLASGGGETKEQAAASSERERRRRRRERSFIETTLSMCRGD